MVQIPARRVSGGDFYILYLLLGLPQGMMRVYSFSNPKFLYNFLDYNPKFNTFFWIRSEILLHLQKKLIIWN